ncbi:MAG: Gfo/Idh/MocA family oxidoreductase [Anaerolineae bacterium]|nr:Gfo/Idh/MocA family oxidoreductase [Anaerolineae bacterium]
MRVGIVGAGSMGTTHSAGWKYVEETGGGAILAGITDYIRSGAEALAERHDCAVYDSYDDLLADVDIVDICTPSNLHHDMVIRAARAGKHIMCEKPIALTIAEGRAMIDACRDAHVRFFIGLVVRFIPEYRTAQEVVAAGQIGEPRVIRLTRVSYQPFKATDNWFVDEERSGGMVLDLMLHDYDYARWLAGNVTRVFAKSVRATRPAAPGDYALVTLRFANGAIAHIEGGWAYPPGFFRKGFDIAGTDGVIESHKDTTNPVITHLAEAPEEAISDVAVPVSAVSASPYTFEIQHFYDAVVNDTPFFVTPEDALAALQIGLAVRESLKTGRSVTIDQEVI